jgi:hypothetical protein
VFKRLFWLVTGASFGFGSSFWLMRAVRRTVDRFRPSAVVSRLEGDVRAAVSEGRVAMREREESLRSARTAARASRAARPALGPGRSAAGPGRPGIAPEPLTPAR